MWYEVAKEGHPWVRVQADCSREAAEKRYGEVRVVGRYGVERQTVIYVFLTKQDQLVKVRQAQFTRKDLKVYVYDEIIEWIDDEDTEGQLTERIMDLVDMYVEGL